MCNNIYSIMSNVRLYLHRSIYNNDKELSNLKYKLSKYFTIENSNDRTSLYINYDSDKYTPTDVTNIISDIISSIIISNINDIKTKIKLSNLRNYSELSTPFNVRSVYNIILIDPGVMRLEL